MNCSIYHFFANLIAIKESFWTQPNLETLPYNDTIIAYRDRGAFPHVCLKVSADASNLTGGELIELKSAKSYTISSFNSQIPQQHKRLEDLAPNVVAGMRQNDSATDSLPIRDVYYLVRVYRERNNIIAENKICLVSGKFFETIQVKDLIQEVLEQVISEKEATKNLQIPDEFKSLMAELISEQEIFSRRRYVPNASVSIRFQIETQFKGSGNIMNPIFYPEIGINTLNLVLPFYSDSERDTLQHHIREVMTDGYEELEQFELKHPYNGSFWVFQLNIAKQ